jgi:hypothetical protein
VPYYLVDFQTLVNSLYMKSIQIYKTNKNFKILTLYKLSSGSYIASEPIFILDSDIELKILGDKILEALNASHTLKESEEDKFWLGTNLLKKIKASSFNKFYETSTICDVSFDNKTITITKLKYLGKNKGLEEGEVYKIAYNEDNFLETVNILCQMF